jgi:hypothetical protein
MNILMKTSVYIGFAQVKRINLLKEVFKYITPPLNYMRRKKSATAELEMNELEKLAERFGKCSGMVDIKEGNVYGYVNKKREYLGSYSEYTRYRILKSKYKNKEVKDDVKKKKEEAYKSFLASSRSN